MVVSEPSRTLKTLVVSDVIQHVKRKDTQLQLLRYCPTPGMCPRKNLMSMNTDKNWTSSDWSIREALERATPT